MLKFFQTTKDAKLPIAFFGSVALLALATATPASAQGVPAGLLRLDPVVSSDNGRQTVSAADRTHAKNRNSFAHDRQSRRQTSDLVAD
jgi:hypothetical protein